MWIPWEYGGFERRLVDEARLRGLPVGRREPEW